MRAFGKFGYFSSSSTTTTVTYNFHNDHTSRQANKEIPVRCPSPKDQPPPTPIPITVHVSASEAAAAAASKIQSAYRAHMIRTLYKKIWSVNSEADKLQAQIQRQETVDAIRSSERQKVRMNEALMSLLFRLDSVPGVDPTVREARRKVSRRIVGLQEILDAICESKVGCDDGVGRWEWEWNPYSGVGGGGFWRNWDEVVGAMEEEVCRERGGDEMDRFCAQYLGFRCLQRFLREP